jgi:hypothetical protein
MLAVEHGNRPDAHDVVVFITDGESFTPTNTANQAKCIHEKGATVISIGMFTILLI